MGVTFVLLQCIFKAIAKNAVKGVVNAFSLGVGGDILTDAWDLWQQSSNEKQRAADVQALAAASPVEVAATAAEIVQTEGVRLSDTDKQIVTDYLQQVPAMIHQSQRRPADPEGKTILPGTTFKKPEDLLRLLPPQPQPPRFKPRDRPKGIGDWELVDLLGRGGFGEVWLAKNWRFDGVEPVALKFCLDPAAKERLLQHEAAILNQVMRQGQHPGIVALRHTYLDADPPCLEYEYVPGGNLAGLIRDKGLTGGFSPFKAARIIQWLAEIAGFAHGLHPPIVHRDLKPANILVQALPRGRVLLKVADFGIGGLAIQHARDASRRPTSADFLTAAVLGSYTLLYASPQQKRGDSPQPSDDVYALGVIWHQLLAGDVTKSCPTGRGWQKRLTDRGMPPAMLDLLIDCCGDEREERPASGGELAEQLARSLVGWPPKADSTEPEKPPKTEPKGPEKPPTTEQLEKPLTNFIGIQFKLIRAGTFLMGSPKAEVGRLACEGPQHSVTISRPFYLGIYPVTQRQYEAVMGCNPSLFAGNPDHPVEKVSWEDAVEFCTRLSALTPEKEAGRAYRLPTEAEWEFACRAGTTTPFQFGKSAFSTACSTQANFDGNHPYGGAAKGPYIRRTSTVGSYPPNGWGQFDMHGNVREWCADWFAADYYGKRENTDPKGPPTGNLRVLRGGSWGSKGKNCRAASREGGAPEVATAPASASESCA